MVSRCTSALYRPIMGHYVPTCAALGVAIIPHVACIPTKQLNDLAPYAALDLVYDVLCAVHLGMRVGMIRYQTVSHVYTLLFCVNGFPAVFLYASAAHQSVRATPQP